MVVCTVLCLYDTFVTTHGKAGLLRRVSISCEKLLSLSLLLDLESEVNWSWLHPNAGRVKCFDRAIVWVVSMATSMWRTSEKGLLGDVVLFVEPCMMDDSPVSGSDGALYALQQIDSFHLRHYGHDICWPTNNHGRLLKDIVIWVIIGWISVQLVKILLASLRW